MNSNNFLNRIFTPNRNGIFSLPFKKQGQYKINKNSTRGRVVEDNKNGRGGKRLLHRPSF